MNDVLVPVSGADELQTGTVRQCMSSDIDEHTEQLQGWDLTYDQLDCGRFEGGFVDIRWPGMQLFRESTTRSVRQRGALIPGSVGVAMPVRGDGGATFNGARLGAGSLLVCSGDEVDMFTPPGCMLVGLVVDSRTLDAAMGRQQDGAVLLPHIGLKIAQPSEALAQWRLRLCAMLDAIVQQPQLVLNVHTRDCVQSEIVGSLLNALSESDVDAVELGATARKRLVDNACKILLAESDQPPSLDVLCRRLGTSPRKLDYCFHDFFGMSPARVVKAMRLNAVRRELSRSTGAGHTVYDVAARWGFWHFSHFSRTYKRQFDELPSQTLRRARG